MLPRIFSHFVAFGILYFLTPMSRAEIQEVFKAYVPGYLNNSNQQTSGILPISCSDWLAIELGDELAGFSFELRSNMPFNSDLYFPAKIIEGNRNRGICVPVISLATPNVIFEYPVSIRIVINDAVFAEINDSINITDDTLSDEFSVSPLVCIPASGGQMFAHPQLYQTAAKTFAGTIKFELVSNLPDNSCESSEDGTVAQQERPEICDCSLNGNADSAMQPQLPLLTAEVAHTDEAVASQAIMEREAAKERHCAAIFDGLDARQIEYTRSSVPKICWESPILDGLEEFDAEKTFTSNIRAASTLPE